MKGKGAISITQNSLQVVGGVLVTTLYIISMKYLREAGERRELMWLEDLSLNHEVSGIHIYINPVVVKGTTKNYTFQGAPGDGYRAY